MFSRWIFYTFCFWGLSRAKTETNEKSSPGGSRENWIVNSGRWVVGLRTVYTWALLHTLRDQGAPQSNTCMQRVLKCVCGWDSVWTHCSYVYFPNGQCRYLLPRRSTQRQNSRAAAQTHISQWKTINQATNPDSGRRIVQNIYNVQIIYHKAGRLMAKVRSRQLVC